MRRSCGCLRPFLTWSGAMVATADGGRWVNEAHDVNDVNGVNGDFPPARGRAIPASGLPKPPPSLTFRGDDAPFRPPELRPHGPQSKTYRPCTPTAPTPAALSV